MDFADKNFYVNAQTFCSLVDNKTITKVSRTLNISIPTVNKRIDLLQDELGEVLLTKQKKNITINPKGLEFYSLFKKHDDDLTNKIIRYKEKKNNEKTTIKISLANGVANQILSDKLAKYVYENKNINLEIYYQNREIDLVKEHYDIAIIRHIPKKQTIKVKKLFETRFNAYCTPEYLKKYGEIKTGEDFINTEDKHLYLGNITDANINYSDINIMYKGKEPVKYNPKFRFSMSHNDYAVLLANTNEMIVGTFDYNVQEELKNGTLVKILPDYSFAIVELFLIQLDTFSNPEVEKLIEYIEQCFKEVENYRIK